MDVLLADSGGPNGGSEGFKSLALLQLGSNIEVDTTAIPRLEGSASIIKEWASDVNPAFGKQYQVQQLLKLEPE